MAVGDHEFSVWLRVAAYDLDFVAREMQWVHGYTKDILRIAVYLSISLSYTVCMAIVLKRKIVKIGNSLRVTIPMEVCQVLKLNVGDTLEFSSTNGEIVISKGKS
jgi:hypothetical protein